MKQFLVVVCIGVSLVACGNPGGVDDEFYEKYTKMGAPKILFQCANRIGYSVGIGINATYNKLVQDAERDCDDDDFKILQSKE